jgi:hypothetical protein
MAKQHAVNTSRLAPPLIVLRKVDVRRLSRKARPDMESVYEMIGKGQLEAGVSEKDTIWYEQGYIVNDQPRTSGVTEEIIGATQGFAVARTDNGDVVREVDTLLEAVNLISGATLQLNVEVEMEDAGDPPDDFDPDAMDEDPQE